MKTLLPFFAIAIAAASIGHSQENSATHQNPGTDAVSQLRWTHTQRFNAASREFEARIAEYRNGRSPITAVLQSNQRMLVAALDAKVPDAGLAYEKRAAMLESLAQHLLDSSAGTVTELAQARECRLDVILRNVIGESNPR